MSKKSPTRAFINLPVTDLKRATAFYLAIGGEVNPAFSDDNASCIVMSEHVFFMLLRREFFQSFLERPVADTHAAVGAIVALTVSDRAEVDRAVAAGIAAGGVDAERPQDHGFMYSRQLNDPDGNVLEFFWMDSAAAQGGPGAETRS